MQEGNETFQVALDLSSENKQLLMKHFPRGTIRVASVEIDGETGQLKL